MHSDRFGLTEEQDLAIAEKEKAKGRYKNFKTFSLTGQQKNILNSLAPLIREDKYSEESLNLLKSLHLKPSNQTFLVQEEIIPDPHTAFGTAKSSYLPLKEKFLRGEQKALLASAKRIEKELNEEDLQKNKLSILNSLINYAQQTEENLNLNLSLDD
jgi:hypothetical protein